MEYCFEVKTFLAWFPCFANLKIRIFVQCDCNDLVAADVKHLWPGL